MSFTSTVKNELSKLELDNIEAISCMSAILKNSAEISNSIKLSTENASVARFIFSLFKKIYNIGCKITVRKGYNYNKNYIYILQITNKTEKVLNDMSLNKNIPSKYIIDDDNLCRMYLRGLFIACGSINDPKKSRYHLEFTISNEEYSKFVCNLLNNYNLNCKYIKRENKYMIYIKESEKIGDFLRMINAITALFYYEDIRIYRDHKNMTNRLNNCEQANVDKIILTANSQLDDINTIIGFGGIDLLDEKTIQAAMYRIKYNESSLQELSEIMTLETSNPITKSGLHHRFNKIKEMATKIRKK